MTKLKPHVVPVGLLLLSQGHVVLVTSVAVWLWIGKNYNEVSHRLMGQYQKISCFVG
jgi:hypothetical protein